MATRKTTSAKGRGGGALRAVQPIRIASEEQFSSLLNALTDDTAYALIHWRLYQGLTAAIKPYIFEMNDSTAFWQLTHQAHWQTALSRLARLYDDYPGTLSLPNFLATIRANLHLFDQDRFRERLKGNPFVGSLAANARRPDLAILDLDARTVDAARMPQVKKLQDLRHQLLAHRATSVVHGKTDPLQALTRMDVAVLCDSARTIVNRYTRLFRASTDMMEIIGHDDYKRVLEHVRKGMDATRRRIEREFARAMRPAKEARP